MYPNLNAEQKRKAMTNAQLAAALGVKRSTLEYKKRNNRFLVDECLTLCKIFNCDFDYLFDSPTELEKQ